MTVKFPPPASLSAGVLVTDLGAPSSPEEMAPPTAVEQPPALAGWSGNPSKSARGPAGVQALTRLQQLNSALAASQQTGVFGSAVANVMTGGAVGSARKSLADAVANVNALATRLIEADGGTLTDKKAHVLSQAIDFAFTNLKDQTEIRPDVVDTTANVATTAVLAAAAVPTGGASLAGLATIGAGTKAGLKVAMDGEGYTHDQALSDIATGGLEGAVAGVGSKAARSALAAKAAKAQAEAARGVMSDLRFEFVRVNSRQDPAVLKPLVDQAEKLKAAGHTFTKKEEGLLQEITRYLGSGRAARRPSPGGVESI